MGKEFLTHGRFVDDLFRDFGCFDRNTRSRHDPCDVAREAREASSSSSRSWMALGVIDLNRVFIGTRIPSTILSYCRDEP